MIINFEGVEWSFFHWEEQNGRNSEVTITTRSNGNSNYSINKFELPQASAQQLEKSLEEIDKKKNTRNKIKANKNNIYW